MIRWSPWVLTVVLAAVLAVPAWRHWQERPPAPPAPMRASWLPPEDADLGAGTFAFGVALAPGGRQVAFAATRLGRVDLWLHDLRTNEARVLPSTEGAAAPFWSPDASRVGFFSEGHLRAIDLASGEVSALVEVSDPRGAAWNAAGDLLFAPAADSGLMVRAATGEVRVVTTPDAGRRDTSHRWPAWLPDGRRFIYLVRSSDPSREGIWIASLDAPSAARRLVGANAQALVAGGHVLYASDDALLAQPIDPVTGELAGGPELVGLPVGHGLADQLFATASDDVLLFAPPGTTLRELTWATRDGAPLDRLGDPLDAWNLRIAPDGRRVLLTGLDQQLRTFDVWIHDGAGVVPLRLSPSTGADVGGAWSPDGLRAAWIAGNRRVTIRGAGAVLPEQVVADFDPPVRLFDWTRDGRWLVVGRTAASSGDDLWLVPSSGRGDPQPYAEAPFNQVSGVVSPDGRWMAYASDESGHFDIYVDTFPKPGARTRVTTAGGTDPRWRSDGRELAFRRGSEVYAATVSVAAGRFASQPAERLFDAGPDLRAYDLAPDGKRFMLNQPAASAGPRAARLVIYWRPS